MLPVATFTSSPSVSKFISTHPPLTLLETKCRTTKDLQQIHAQIVKSGLHNDPFALSRLLNFCCTSSSPDLHYAFHLFSHTPRPTNFMFNSLIRAFSKSSDPHFAIVLFLAMLYSEYAHPTHLTYPSVFAAIASLGSSYIKSGRVLHGFVMKQGFNIDIYVHNSILQMYASCSLLDEAYRLFETFDVVSCNSLMMGLAKAGLVNQARHLFDEMPVRNKVSWSTIISGYVRNGLYLEALQLFTKMQMEGVEPNEHVLVSLLSACAHLGALEQGEWICKYVKCRFNIETNSIMSTKVIEMYCKCGRLDKAKEVFDSLSMKGLSTWNAMILGLALHGNGKEANVLFMKLEESGLCPDEVSFLSLLTACNHSGLVPEARYYFRKMRDVYDIEPRVEHYGCLVDVLGRAGLVEEAEVVIKGMGVKPDKVIWTSLLWSCMNNGDMERGKKAARKIRELDPCEGGGYVMMSNGYAREGEFGASVKERLRMKEWGVRKDPGSSVVEVDGGVHEFFAGGVLHGESGEIGGVLNGLILNIRDEYGSTFLSASSPTPPIPSAIIPPRTTPPPTPLDPPTLSSSLSAPSLSVFPQAKIGQPSYASLFRNKPRNAGKYYPVDITPSFDGEDMKLTSDIVKASSEVWCESLVGFFPRQASCLLCSNSET